MYELNDTIVAVSSPTSGERVIVRISGPATIDKVEQIFSPPIAKEKSGCISGFVSVDDELRIDAKLYLFLAPHSYTGEDVAEIHICANLAAAEKLLAGRLAETTAKVCSSLIDCLSLVEAGLDFSGEDIEFITRDEAVERLAEIKGLLEQLLSGSCSDESVIDLPAVGIAGAPNAGKSSLLNRLLGKPRSIVSERRKTTRDVLTGLMTLTHCRCVLFDCAGLTQSPKGSHLAESRKMGTPGNVLDELAQAAAVESLQKASMVVFCIDISKPDWSEDIAIRFTIEPEVLIPVATKCDLLSEDVLTRRLAELGKLFAVDFLATSAKTSDGMELLRQKIDQKIIELAAPGAKQPTSCETRDTRHEIALTARHKQAVDGAIENISESISELKAGNDEITAMMLRAAYQNISNIEQGHIDEQILEKIFSRFCIGK
jgi:tRNA modification GTPase